MNAPAGARAAAAPPSPSEGRRLLDTELADPAYARSWWERFRRWLAELFSSDGAVGSGDLTPLFAVLGALLVLVVAVLVWHTLRRRLLDLDTPVDGVITESGTGADEYRERARVHLAAGRADEALLDAFRALAAHADETGVAPASPARTAGSLARLLGASRPDLATALLEGALVFDAVRYGGAEATAADAEALLTLGDRLRTTGSGQTHDSPRPADLVPPGAGR